MPCEGHDTQMPWVVLKVVVFILEAPCRYVCIQLVQFIMCDAEGGAHLHDLDELE